MTELLSSDWSHALGWTLFHSIWQSAIILLIALLCLRLTSTRRSELRYGIVCGAMLLFVLTALVTFSTMTGNPATHEQGHPAAVATGYLITPDTLEANAWPPDKIIRSVAATIEASMPWLLLLWGAGFLFFSARFSAALMYTWKLRTLSTPLTDAWSVFIADAAASLGIRREVALGEAASISSPMVLGYLRPIILVPTGMLTGLSSEQLETIFLHELAHIKRHDYLMNLAQSLVETIFFFNPFVWVLSNAIRREREYCCDDLVVRYHGDSRVYAHALVQLAEARLTSPGFALSLADDKNQLLNRIKRIMERSAKNYSGKSRLAIPVILLFSALMCISWLGMKDENSADTRQRHNEASLSADTVPAKKGNTATYSRKSIITIDENGQPHEEVVEEFEGDESLRPLLERQFQDFPHANAPGFPQFPSFALPGMTDTIPHSPGFRNSEEWEEHARALAENFRNQFEMFGDFPHDSLFMQGFADKWEDFDVPESALKALEEFDHSEMFKHLEEEMKRLRGFDFDQFDQSGPLNRSQGYEGALQEQLLKDGYLNEGESIQSLEWNNDSFKVNGKSVDKDDLEKYQKLSQEFFGRSGQPGKLE